MALEIRREAQRPALWLAKGSVRICILYAARGIRLYNTLLAQRDAQTRSSDGRRVL
jgi:hypothetical protein